MASVTLANVTKNYGNQAVIHGIDIDIADGSFVALVGPSGCGKSTLLRMVAGLESITGGEISIGERVINDLAPKDRDIAMVFQNYALYPHMTVAENMGFSLKLAGVALDERMRRVSETAKILGLEDLLHRYPKQLSGGQRQRVAMGRAIVRNPQVFLFDEPLSNLDAKLRVAMRAEIKQLHQRLRTTTIFVTHDQVEAMTMADTVVVMQGGHVEQIGAPLTLYDNPRNLFVAGFIGSPAMNLLSGELVRDAGVFVNLEGGVELAAPAVDAPASTKVIYGIRPEHLSLENPNRSAEVLVVEPTGSETTVIMRFGKQELLGVFRERIRAQPGDRLDFSLPVEKVHLFDQASGLRISPATTERL